MTQHLLALVHTIVQQINASVRGSQLFVPTYTLFSCCCLLVFARGLQQQFVYQIVLL